MLSVIDRAAANEAYHARLQAEPLSVAEAEGYAVPIEAIFAAFGEERSESDPTELVDFVAARLSQVGSGKWF
jgi:hypothetical protein